MLASAQDFGKDVFEPPTLSFDAIMDREEGKHPFGMQQAVMDDMFEAFALRTIELSVQIAHALGFTY